MAFAALVTAVVEGVPLMSDVQVAAGIDAVGLSGVTPAEMANVDVDARTVTFKSGVAYLLFMAIVGIILLSFLPEKMLVEAGNLLDTVETT